MSSLLSGSVVRRIRVCMIERSALIERPAYFYVSLFYTLSVSKKIPLRRLPHLAATNLHMRCFNIATSSMRRGACGKARETFWP